MISSFSTSLYVIAQNRKILVCTQHSSIQVLLYLERYATSLMIGNTSFQYHALSFRHYDMKSVGNFVAVEDNKADLFPLQISLSISGTTNSLVVKISQKVI